MKNKSRIILFAGLLALMGPFLLALSLVMLISVPKESFQSQQASIKNIRGLDKLEVKASGSTLPLSSFSSYDQAHGTKLYYMANQLPSVSTNQFVTSSDFEQLQSVAEKQLGEQPQKVSCWWSLLRYLLMVAGLISAPIWTKLLANLTDDCIYPLCKDALLKRLKRGND